MCDAAHSLSSVTTSPFLIQAFIDCPAQVDPFESFIIYLSLRKPVSSGRNCRVLEMAEIAIKPNIITRPKTEGVSISSSTQNSKHLSINQAMPLAFFNKNIS